MVYTVTLNPSIDCLISVDRLTAGTLHRAAAQVLRPGGKGINVSLTLKQLGVQTCALGFIAGQTGALFRDLLAHEQLAHRMLSLPSGQTRINVKIAAGEETELNGAGPTVDAASFAALTDALSALTAQDILVLCGALPVGLPADCYARLAGAAHGARVIVDASGDALRQALTVHPFLVKPNLAELSEILGMMPKTTAQIAAGAAQLVEGGAQHVLVSMGASGALLHCSAGTWLLEAPAGQSRGTVGAGDAMVAGFVEAMLRNVSREGALCCAVAAGSAAAFSDWLPTKDQFARVLAQIDSPRFVCYNH